MSLDWPLIILVAILATAVCTVAAVTFTTLLKLDEAEAASDAWSNK